MASRNKLTMCRLCLSENECFINIFELNDWQGYVAAEVISNLLQFQVCETDGFPHVVCSKCMVKLTDFKLFKECCQKSMVTYDKMFLSSECLEEHKPKTDVDEVGSGLELCERDPLGDTSPEPVIKQEELDIDCTSDDRSDKPFEGTNTKPIIKEEELDIDCTSGDESYKPFQGTNTQEKLIKSETSGIAFEPAATSKEDSTQEADHGGSGAELSEDDSLREASSDEEDGEKETGGRKGRLECHCCKKVLTTKCSLKQHLASHGIGTFPKCKACGKMCVSEKKLEIHSRTHKDEGPYKCTVCAARFANSDSLRLHMGIHAETKPFKCDVCDVSFRHCSSLCRHMKIHSVSKSYSCVVCHANFRQRSNLTNHMKIHSGIGQHKCIVCSTEFTRGDQLRRHMIEHLEDKPLIDTSDHR